MPGDFTDFVKTVTCSLDSSLKVSIFFYMHMYICVWMSVNERGRAKVLDNCSHPFHSSTCKVNPLTMLYTQN